MKRTLSIFAVLLLVAVVFTTGSQAIEKRRTTRTDSLRTTTSVRSTTHRPMGLSRRSRELSIDNSQMASSTFPVRMVVKGSSLCVTSDYSQILPIYTRGGSFYMAMHLNKGLNWLNGLPRGRYLINHQTISIP